LVHSIDIRYLIEAAEGYNARRYILHTFSNMKGSDRLRTDFLFSFSSLISRWLLFYVDYAQDPIWKDHSRLQTHNFTGKEGRMSYRLREEERLGDGAS
ncbi:hypothetical protein PFISCL1PPCAC_21878, partial [Pristionchus fissidentatus]